VENARYSGRECNLYNCVCSNTSSTSFTISPTTLLLLWFYVFFFYLPILFSLLPLALPRPPVAYINPLGDLGPLHKLPGDWSLYNNSHFLPSPTNTKSLLLFFLINIASNDCINHFGKDGKVGCRKFVVGDNQRRALLCHL